MYLPTGTHVIDRLVTDRRDELMAEAAHRRATRVHVTHDRAAAPHPCNGRLRCYATRLLARLA